MTHAPRWRDWAAPIVLVGLLVASLLISVVVALAAAAFGADDLTPGLVLVLALVDLALAWVILRLVARAAGVDLEPPGAGLRRVGARMGLVMLAFGLAVAAVAAGLTLLLGDIDLPHPGELGGETTVVQLDLASATTILARAVLAAITIELVLRGFLVAALMPRFGRTGAIVAAGLLTATLVPLELAPAAAAVGIALGVMYAESGSILPGIGLAGAVNGLVLGVRFDWSAPECVALAVVTGALAFLLVAVPTRSWDRDPRPS